jgi:hypothetical protein
MCTGLNKNVKNMEVYYEVFIGDDCYPSIEANGDFRAL